MATGQPLFAGKTDIDQLWLIAKSTGYLTPQQLHHVQSAPGTARFRMPNRQMRDTLECRFPRLTYAQLQVVKVLICVYVPNLSSATFTARSVAVVNPTCKSVAAPCVQCDTISFSTLSTDVFDQVNDNPGTSEQPSWLAEDVHPPPYV